MSRTIVAELFISSRQLSADVIRGLVEALVHSGFTFEQSPGEGGRYWLEMEPHDARPLDEAVDAFRHGVHWGVVLGRRLISGEWVDVVLEVEKGAGSHHGGFDRLDLSTPMSLVRPEPVLSQQFLAWATFVAELTNPWYGWGGDSRGLPGQDAAEVSTAALLALAPQPIEWLNIVGPPYVRHLGVDRLLSIPTWRVEFLANDSIAFTLGPHPDLVPKEAASRAATHLDFSRG